MDALLAHLLDPSAFEDMPIASRHEALALLKCNPGMTDQEIEAALVDVPGIGPWTARGFLLVALDRPDVFLSGDLALRRAIRREYAIDHLPTDDELVELSDRWRPYRSLAVSYLFASEYDGQE